MNASLNPDSYMAAYDGAAFLPAPVEESPASDESASPEWVQFPDESDSLGIPRASMPQIQSRHRGALTQYLKSRGITHAQVEVTPESLKPSQSEFSPAKVNRARGFDGPDRPVLISADRRIIDGHHEWLKNLVDAPTTPIPAIQFDAPAHQLLIEAARFPSSGVDERQGATSVAPQQQSQTPKADELTPDSYMNQHAHPAHELAHELTPDSFMDQQSALPHAASHVSEDVDFSSEDEARHTHPYVPVELPVSDEDTRMVEPSSWGRRAVLKVAEEKGIPEKFAIDWMDHQQVNGRLKTYDLQTRSPFGNTQELLKATGYDPEKKSLTLHVDAGMVDQLQQDYEESKGYFRKLADVVEDPHSQPGAVAYQAVAPVVSGVAHGLDLITRPLQAASIGAIGLDRAVDPVVGMSQVYATGKPTNPLDTLKGIPGAMAEKFMTGDTRKGYETPLTAVTENFAGDHIPESMRPLVHLATEVFGDPLTYLTVEGVGNLGRFSKGARLARTLEHDEEALSKVAALYEEQTGVRPVLTRTGSGYEVTIPGVDGGPAWTTRYRPGAAPVVEMNPGFTLKENIYSALGIPRSVITAADLSASGRQGAMLSAGHPLIAAESFAKQLRAFASEGAARKLSEAITSHPHYEQLKEAGLFLPDLADSSLTVAAREEAFGSRFANRVPLVRRSERAFNAFLNNLRFRVASDIITSHPGMSASELKEVCRALNVLTGRGSLGPLDKYAAGTAQILFAPRLLASRLQTPLLLASKSPVARKEAARALVGFLGANMAFLSLAKLAGADVELDPRSSDFLRAKFGDTRVDLMSGYQAPLRYSAQFLMGKRKGTDSKEVKSASRVDIAEHLVRTRLAPQVGVPIDLITGSNVAGEKVGPGDAALSAFTFLSARDIYEAIKADRKRGGIGARGASLGALALLGVGVSTYSTKPATQAQKDYVRSLAAKSGETIDVERLTSGDASQIINRLKKAKSGGH